MTKTTAAQRKAQTAIRTSKAVFGIGVAVSLAANVIAAEHTPIGIAVGLWIPIAFLLSMLMLENVPARGWKGKVRFAAMLVVAGIAGWTSYWHLVDVAEMGGADQVTAHLLPLTVDVMMALASQGMKKATATVRRPARKPAAKKPATAKVTALKAV
jgi:apolipoprotein N-acyltransferase